MHGCDDGALAYLHSTTSHPTPGLARAKELIFRARRLGAAEALRWGVVHSAHPTAEALAAECRAVCGDIAANVRVGVWVRVGWGGVLLAPRTEV